MRVRGSLRVNGIVQGVGFRPHVYRLAQRMGLTGQVRNDDRGVHIEIEGTKDSVEAFRSALVDNSPPLAVIQTCTFEDIPLVGDREFLIRESSSESSATTSISPDIATCGDCLNELYDPSDRRYRYPFINCTNCGPRYTIIQKIPYDRPYTSMAGFTFCSSCEREYRDPSNRRFHAQPNACPACGPKVWLQDGDGRVNCSDPIAETVARLKRGEIAAVRGVGGYHLVVDAANEQAVRQLRRRKGREEKPLALMAPDAAAIRRICHVSSEEQALLESHTRPIVLLEALPEHGLAESVAPGNRFWGFMLPYTPLHHLLLRDNFDALVMTSGNLSEEPIAIGNEEALARLQNLADFFLLHDREILQRCDDSIARVAAGEPGVIRRARGYVPAPISLPVPVSIPVLACGGELKNTIALARGEAAFLSQHIGDLDNPAAYDFYKHCIDHLQNVLQITPGCLAHDLHPGYLSTKWALRQEELPNIAVQHHHAHLVSVMTDNGITAPTIGIVLDGTGFGTDGTVWGGEILVGDAAGFERRSWLQPVPMPGGEAAIKQPWRMAVSWLLSVFGAKAQDLRIPLWENLKTNDVDLLRQMIDRDVNSPKTSSCGRLFDSVSAMLGLCREVTYEAQGAIALEMVAGEDSVEAYEYDSRLGEEGPIDVGPLIRAIVRDLERGEPVELIAGRFHHTLSNMLVGSVVSAREKSQINRVGLSGGAYQNKLLFEYMVGLLEKEGFEVLTHHQVPTNDGGLALGQAVIAGVQYASGDR
ncbi:MAG: carbamoyltransferase HypF [bacterium]|nr:carbamoyltransferase HypF [bacterium]